LHSSAGNYGADLQLLALAAGLDPERYNPLVVLPERGSLASALDDAAVETVLAPLAVLRRAELGPRGIGRLARKMRADRRRLGALARDRGVALVHSNTSVVLSGDAIARAAGAAHVVHVREIYAGAGGARAAWAWPLLRRRLERADALVCVSRAVAEQFGPGTRARVVNDGLRRAPTPAPRAEARAALGLGPDRFVVALLGRISDWKGQDVLARALAEPALAEIGAIGLCAGDPYPGNESALRELEALRDELGLGKRLRLLGFRSDVEVVLGAADAVAVPSTRPDPLPNSALEAAAAGLPVVGAAHGGIVEIVRDGVTGRLVEPGSAAALASALRALADDHDAAHRLGVAGATDARERFSASRMLDEVQRLYDELLRQA